MKRFLAFVLLVVMTAALLASAATADTYPYYVYSRNGKKLNVRPEPNTHNNPIAKLANGTKVDVKYFNGNNWACIDYEGREAWVSANFLVAGTPDAAPTVAEETVDAKTALANELASEKAVENPYYIIARPARLTGWVNLRVGPGKNTRRVTTYKSGQTLQVTAETTRWYKVTDWSGRTGYIYKGYAMPLTSTDIQTPADANKQSLGKLNVNGDFDLECTLPEGYTLQVINVVNESIIATATSQDVDKPVMYVSIAFDETLSDVASMNDMKEEDLTALEKTFREADTVDISFKETTHGTKLMVVREVGDDTDFLDIFTVYKGYLIEFNMTPNPKASKQAITDEQVAQAVQFLSDLNFVETAK